MYLLTSLISVISVECKNKVKDHTCLYSIQLYLLYPSAWYTEGTQ